MYAFYSPRIFTCDLFTNKQSPSKTLLSDTPVKAKLLNSKSEAFGGGLEGLAKGPYVKSTSNM